MKKWPLRQIVEIEWTDILCVQRWGSKDQHSEETPMMCRSVGYLLRKDARQVTLVQSMALDNGEVGESIIVPRSCVKKIRSLK